MLRRSSWAIAAVLLAVGSAQAQNDAVPDNDSAAWRRIDDSSASAAGTSVTPAEQPAPQDALATVSSAVLPVAPPAKPYVPPRDGSTTLPDDAGQVWREYDISPYTTRVTTTNRPEQAIVDWILRETGYEVWHNEPFGILSAGPQRLRVYHTPQMQSVVADLINRFVGSEAASYTFSLRVVTLDNPGWRTTAQRLLHPVPVQTPGTNAWLLAKEDAAVLLGELRRRSDYREHSSPYLMVNNGQSTLVSAMRGRPYVRDVVRRSDAAAGYEPSPGQVDEGFNLDFSPLLSSDRRLIDATVRCNIDQIEKMIPVMVDVPTQALPHQRAKVEVPQITHYRFHERYRWPVDQVLLIGVGMVALPIPVDGAPLLPGVPLPIGNSPARADMLIFAECKGPTATAQPADSSSTARTALQPARNYRGRY